MNQLIELKNLLSAFPRPRVVITTHHKPDADALGSSLGLLHFLVQLGVPAHVVSPTDYGDFLKWMPGEKEVINFETEKEKATALVAAADLIFCLDFNTLSRINLLGDFVANSKAKKILIDHHLEPDGFDDYRLWTTNASSTSELIFWLIELFNEVDKVNEAIASCLYAGIMTDTASFKHNSTKPTTHRVAAKLLEKGAQPNRIHEAIYDNYSENRMRFIGYCLNEKLQVIHAYKTALIVVSAEELERFQIITGDTEGLVNYGLSIAGIELSILVVDRKVARKMSFRSKSKFPANAFARKHFNGGGHFNAAGGESSDDIHTIEKKIKHLLPEYIAYLN